MPIASLAMYVSPAPLKDATRLFWETLADRLRAVGLDAPAALQEDMRYDEPWLRPDLLFAQTCGYPYVQRLRGQVQLVATPVYGLPGCDGPLKCSFIIVNAGSSARSIEDLRGARAAINDPGSNSGYNLFRAFVAPHAVDGRFFSSVLQTGGHVASIDAVSSGAADIAAIDCVTFGNTLRFDPDRVAGVRILAETKKVRACRSSPQHRRQRRTWCCCAACLRKPLPTRSLPKSATRFRCAASACWQIATTRLWRLSIAMPPVRDTRRSPDGSAATLRDGRREHQAHGDFVEHKLHRINILRACRFARPLFPLRVFAAKSCGALALAGFLYWRLKSIAFPAGDLMSTDALPPQSSLSAIARIEWQTVALAVAIYGGFLALTWFWQSLPVAVVIGLGGWLIAWHGSLQHEVIHGHPTRDQRINDAIGSVPLSLWLPYGIYREGHLVHHRDEHLTDPIEDPSPPILPEPPGKAWARWDESLPSGTRPCSAG